MPPNQVAQLIGGAPPPNTSSSWFVGAPISRLYAITTVVFYVLFHSKASHDSMAMDSFRMLSAAQYSGSSSEWHRYWSSKVTFGSTGELVMGGMLLTYLGRQFEREMGSRKFGIFLMLISFSAMVVEMFLVVGVSTLMENGYRYQGPYAVLGALMYLFHRYTPRLHPRFFALLGFTFSEKSFYYFWFTQVVGYGGYSTILATAVGMFTCYVYIVTNLHQTIDLPDAVVKPLASLGAHISDPPPRILAPNTRGGRAGAAVAGGGAGADALQRLMRNNPVAAQAAAAAAAPRPAAPPAPPDPAAIEQLCSMGFDRQRVTDALRATNNNVERAADRLLAG